MTAEALQSRLVADLGSLGERFADEKFSTELYRALTRNTWSRRDGPDGHVAMSFSEAERLVNRLRTEHGQPELTLAQTGGEGEVSDLVGGELDRLGWIHRELNTSRHDDQHVAKDVESPPPADSSAPEWERQAHAEARERGR